MSRQGCEAVLGKSDNVATSNPHPNPSPCAQGEGLVVGW